MPAIIVSALRFLFIAIMQVAASEVVARTLENLVDYVRDALKKDGKLGDSVINDVMLNETLDILSYVGVTVASLKTKIPLRLADKLGLNTRQLTKKDLTTATKQAVAKVAAGSKLTQGAVKKALGVFAVSFVGSLPWLPGLVQQFGDQATFNPKNANNYYEGLFGVRPFQEPNPADSPGSFSGAEFEEYFLGLQSVGAASINNPCKLQNTVFSKAMLADLVRCVYGQENAAGRSTTANKLKQALAPHIRLSGGIAAPIPQTPATSAGGGGFVGTGASIASTPKVFTGIVSQGVVGKGLVFTPRPDDLIESLEELRSAAANNLASYLAALAGKIVYEVKVVPSVTTKDGFKQTGTTQRVEIGAYSNGIPKYKSVTNKFAVIVIYAVTDKGTRTKLTQITLGPTNSALLRIEENDLRALETALPKLVTTQDLSEVKNIVSDSVSEEIRPATVRAIEREIYTNENGAPALYTEVTENANGSIHIIWRNEKTGRIEDDGDYFTDSESFMKLVAKRGVVGYEYVEGKVKKRKVDPAPDTDTDVSAPVTASNKIGADATTLYEWYQAQGLSLPSVAERSLTYQTLGLGQSSYYTGTTEQNSKLLNALKTQ